MSNGTFSDFNTSVLGFFFHYPQQDIVDVSFIFTYATKTPIFVH